jgi:predicted ATP-dependent serine protease
MSQHEETEIQAFGAGWTDCFELAADPMSTDPPEVVKSGHRAFDDAMPFGGVPHSSITVWVGEMKAGKSRFVLSLCAGYANRGANVAFLMGEMSPKEHFQRLILMCLQLGAEELRDAKHGEQRDHARRWIGEHLGRRLRFKAVPITLEAITHAAEWAGTGGVVVVDSIQRVRLAAKQTTRADEIETVMQHLVDTAKRTGAAFHVLSEVAQAPRDGERTAHQWTKHSAAPRQNCDHSFIVHPAQGETQRIECLDMRNGEKQDFTILLSSRNLMPMLPVWDGGA